MGERVRVDVFALPQVITCRALPTGVSVRWVVDPSPALRVLIMTVGGKDHPLTGNSHPVRLIDLTNCSTRHVRDDSASLLQHPAGLLLCSELPWMTFR